MHGAEPGSMWDWLDPMLEQCWLSLSAELTKTGKMV
jgi:hypothetical protein